jgi:hypothetical protein
LSIKAINYVIDLEIGDPTSKLIMINLANLYNDATEYAYPSQELLAKRSECSIRTVQRKLDNLNKLGFIKVHFRPNKTSLYSFPKINGYDTLDVSDCHIQKNGYDKSANGYDTSDVRTINNNHYININKKNKKKENLLTELVLTDELKKYATDRELDAEEILEDIKLWNEQNGNKKKYANLNAFYMNWCRKEARRKPKAPFKVQSHQKDGKVAVRAEKGLTTAQLNYIDNIVAKVERLQNDPRWAYTNFDRLRNEIETAMRGGNLSEYLNERGLN